MKALFYWLMDKVVWALFVVPALSEWLKDKESTPWISAAFDWVNRHAVGLLGEPAFPWIAGTLLGTAIGVLSHRLLVWTVRRITEDRFEKFDSLSVDVMLHLYNSRGLSADTDVSGLMAKVQRLFTALQNQRVTTPNLPKGDPVPTLTAYINYIRPFIEDRDIRVLRQRAKEWVTAQVKTRVD
ncbi:hypothetical protein AAFO90_19690 [Phaeobacter sp. CAU 1743]|uniref:hypothetical protein n=1 Tax=Phaeobacter sp. CAU 1743 TaxID=3140367 RepID=UPI00325C0A2B